MSRAFAQSGAVLALTGGGILGSFSVGVLKDLEDMRRKALGTEAHLRDAFDLIAGTSAGALIAGALGIGRDAQEIADLFKEHGPKIFPQSRWRNVRHIVMAKYNPAPLKAAIDAATDGKDWRLGDIDIPVLFPAYNETLGQPALFTQLDPLYENMKLSDAILASAAAPTYFPAHRINGERFVDGGIFANAPDLAAFSFLRKRWSNLRPQDISIVSIGTTRGRFGSPLGLHDPGALGLIGWMRKPMARLLKLTMQAQADFSVWLTPHLSLDAYHRIDMTLVDTSGQAYPLDAATPELIEELMDYGKCAITQPGIKTDAIRALVRRNRFAEYR